MADGYGLQRMKAQGRAFTLPFRNTRAKNKMQPTLSNAVIAVVDDDASVRQGLERLIRSSGFQAETFASAQEFLARRWADPPSCLVLDLQLPGLSGLDLQKRMAEIGLNTLTCRRTAACGSGTESPELR